MSFTNSSSLISSNWELLTLLSVALEGILVEASFTSFSWESLELTKILLVILDILSH